MGYSEQEDVVRVDFFRDTGKWYTTEAVRWCGGYSKESGIMEAFRTSLRQHLLQPSGKLRLAGMFAVCLEPYHELSHPLMTEVPNQ